MQDSGGIKSRGDMFYARTSEHGYETCVEHLAMTGCLSGGFAQGVGHLNDGLLAGLFHDLGKYSDAFQRRILDPEHSGRVDHSTAGAMLLVRNGRPEASMAVAGHHAGLADVGGPGELDGSTFSGRMNKAFAAGERSPLALSEAWETQLCVPRQAFQEEISTTPARKHGAGIGERSHYSDMMLTRMLLSALVDGDRLDAEYFTSGRGERAEHDMLERVRNRLDPVAMAEGCAPSWKLLCETASAVASECEDTDRCRIGRLTDIMEHAARNYLDKSDKTSLDAKRCELLTRCLDWGRDASCGRGLYTLTAPTGSGKTFASIAFALEHARTHGLRRIIYVIPYTSIIDQNVGNFERIFGPDAVLPHYAEAPYQLKDESDMSEIDLKRSLAAENWNMPIVVTTAVQFFESLYSNKTSRCRKLHNIANSVIVFDEAQTLPVPYLHPCIKAIAELVERYGVTAVLCTATQPELKPLFDQVLGRDTRIPEISPFSQTDREVFRRVTIERIGDIELDALADRLKGHGQALCVVNTRKKAQYIYGRLAENGDEGVYCLTTLQCAADRRRLLAEIRERLAADVMCQVVSTSLIEAGVDVDFPVAYREETGLDSIIQTAGRCNREGRHAAKTSLVYVFSTEGGCAPFLTQNIAVFHEVAERYPDLASNDAIRSYFENLLKMRDGVAVRGIGNDALDKRHILPLHGWDTSVPMPFERIARQFRLIDTPTVPVYIPLADADTDEGARLCARLEQGDIDRMLFRRLGKYAVEVWPKHLELLRSAGAVLPVGYGRDVEEECFILRDMGLYSARLGLRLADVSADGIFM
ncbi:CRISPR-associated helicase/endonuclease Cas3 [Bifidobacterium stellenboschense]|uniref:CRISPR-associated helicase cas3 n=1 Tax=Bifidobacterium stellenboschense TaxID=762211 RepID=A0A087DU81_9BIFI|nr:CRISPR-associated helicase/endonuclease Cas3 [Bifidobacterium stellenboschense]KFI99081.1 CRISPR-associated helicase cas3 [Bifidobacterium stellenboschense]